MELKDAIEYVNYQIDTGNLVRRYTDLYYFQKAVKVILQELENRKDVTSKYTEMIQSFECDFSLACCEEDTFTLDNLQEAIGNKQEPLMQDIELLKELSFGLRYEKIKIIEQV